MSEKLPSPTATDIQTRSLAAIEDERPLEVEQQALTALALRLVGEPSLSGEEGAVARIVAEEMQQLGLDVETDRLGNVIGTLDAGPGPCVLLDSHMDTVGVSDPSAWRFDPRGELSDGRLYGRGAMDMKGQLAASIHAVAALRGRLQAGRVVVSASIAEELVEGAALLAVAEQVKPDCVVICEASSLRVVRAQRGRVEVTVEIVGRSSHSAHPDLGINAAEAMADLIRGMRELPAASHPLLGSRIAVLTDVVSRPYPGLSVIPDRCVATYDCRTLPGESENEILDPICAILAEALRSHGGSGSASVAIDRFTTYTGATVEAANHAPAWETPLDAPIVVAAVDALRAAGIPAATTQWAFCTNGSGSAGRLGIPTIGYGPGSEELAHRVDEHIEIEDLLAGARGYTAIVPALMRISREPPRPTTRDE